MRPFLSQEGVGQRYTRTLPMKRHLTVASIALAAIAITLAPANAKTKRYYRSHHISAYAHPYGVYAPRGWATRVVSDPSYLSYNYRRAQHLGRCVEDLGYGRYEYCGW
jgi:hypothetical protein